MYAPNDALLEDRLCVVVRRSHPIRRAPTLEQYRAARHIVVSARASGTVLEELALAQFGVERRVSIREQRRGPRQPLAQELAPRARVSGSIEPREGQSGMSVISPWAQSARRLCKARLRA